MSTQAEKDAVVIDAYERLLAQIRRDQESVNGRRANWLNPPAWLLEEKYSERNDRDPEEDYEIEEEE